MEILNESDNEQITIGTQELTIRCDALVQFYDRINQWPEQLGSPVTAITGVIGEDLVLGLLRHYWVSKGNEIPAFNYKCKSVGMKGPRLDAWVLTGDKCFQTEVKNWCACAIGGKDVGHDDTRLRSVAEQNLERYLGHSNNSAAVWKVLAPMEPPADQQNRKICPLLAFWSPVALRGSSPSQVLPTFFSCDLKRFEHSIGGRYPGHGYQDVWVFSASLYLRSLNESSVTLYLPRALHRLRELQKLLIWPE